MPVWLSPWDWTATDWAGLTCLVLVVAAILAWIQAREARKLREERARPFVVVDFVLWNIIIELKIENIGATMARDVRFKFTPPLQSTFDTEAGHTPLREASVFQDGIRSLPPGKEIVMLFDRGPTRTEQGLPDAYEVEVSFTDALGKRRTDVMTIDLGIYRDTSRIRRRELHDFYKPLEDIAKELKKWTVLGSALRVMTPADVKRANDEWEARYEALAAEQQAADAAATTNGEAAEADAPSDEA
jgi:hypothetical protein